METRSIVKEFQFDYPLMRVWNAVTVNEELIHWLADKVTGVLKKELTLLGLGGLGWKEILRLTVFIKR